MFSYRKMNRLEKTKIDRERWGTAGSKKREGRSVNVEDSWKHIIEFNLI